MYALQALQVACLLPGLRLRLLGMRLDSDSHPDPAAAAAAGGGGAADGSRRTGMRAIVDAVGGVVASDGQASPNPSPARPGPARPAIRPAARLGLARGPAR